MVKCNCTVKPERHHLNQVLRANRPKVRETNLRPHRGRHRMLLQQPYPVGRNT